MENIKNKFDKNNNRIILIANKDNISTVFNVIKTLKEKKKVIFEEELNVKHEIKKGKGRAKIYISIRKL